MARLRGCVAVRRLFRGGCRCLGMRDSLMRWRCAETFMFWQNWEGNRWINIPCYLATFQARHVNCRLWLRHLRDFGPRCRPVKIRRPSNLTSITPTNSSRPSHLLSSNCRRGITHHSTLLSSELVNIQLHLLLFLDRIEDSNCARCRLLLFR